MSSKHTSFISGLGDLASVVIVCCILAVCLAIAYAVLMIITYWYISVPAIAIALYAWTKRDKTEPEEKPSSKTVRTKEVSKTETGKIITNTVATYGKQEVGIARTLHMVSANMK